MWRESDQYQGRNEIYADMLNMNLLIEPQLKKLFDYDCVKICINYVSHISYKEIYNRNNDFICFITYALLLTDCCQMTYISVLGLVSGSGVVVEIYRRQ